TFQPDLRYSVSLRNRPVIENAKLGIVIDGVDICRDATVGKVTTYRTNDQYEWRGVHAKAIDRCNGAKIAVRHPETKTDHTIEIRVFDDGIAFRYLLPDIGKTRVPEEGSTFVFPGGSTAWFHDFYGHYEGVHVKKAIDDVKDGEWAAPPLTVKLPGNGGYAAVSEAALLEYGGRGLQADGKRGFKGVLGNALPVSHPYDLRYPKEEAKRLSIPAPFA